MLPHHYGAAISQETDLSQHRLDVISKINVQGGFLWPVILRCSHYVGYRAHRFGRKDSEGGGHGLVHVSWREHRLQSH